MLKYKQKSQFENPIRSISLEGAERYTDVRTGQSTEHAKKVAENYASRESLKEIVKNNLPAKKDLNWMTPEAPYVVKSTDTKGVLDILKRASGDFATKSKLINPDYLRIAYYSMMDYVKTNLGGKSTTTGKPFDVNFLEAEDKVWVKEGMLYINRQSKSKYGSFGVPLYPWGQATVAAPTAAPATPPAPTSTVVTDPYRAPAAPTADPTTATPPPSSLPPRRDGGVQR